MNLEGAKNVEAPPLLTAEHIVVKGMDVSFARPEGPQLFEEHDMRLFMPVVQTIQETLRQNPEHVGALSVFEVKNQRLPYWWDERLPIVVREVLMNALEAVRETSGMKGSVDVASWMQQSPRALVITIDDTGVGLPAQNPEKVFREGYTTKGKSLGGVGLGRCKEFVEKLLGGSFTLGANPAGKGTRCTITLPW